MVLTAQQRVKNFLRNWDMQYKKKSSICNGALTPNFSYSPSTEI